MDIEKIREYCLNKNGVTESFPFDDETLVFKVISKMFCLCNLTFPLSINLKCDPDKAIDLRERFMEITPGYHMNKKHWNTIDINGTLKDTLILEMIDDSYSLCVQKLTKKEKRLLMNAKR